ncbi:low temperature requirement protein A [Skermania piniformis]|uniref:Low temperature requirement protein A n=1 Tax=Skermania pinensis TaxID=39122 RepID=A0ABX8S4L0_9ACTN|nr:low temperature requirement protein A [Skermania piniformis]QXQ12773.1 low temperature requirement protein A [Skermania piniformis]
MTDPKPDQSAERHASWAELFFDLIVVAGAGVFAHILIGDFTLAALGLFAALYLAFWLIWITFTLYGNTAGGETKLVRLLAGMSGLGVMAAAVPGVVAAYLHHEPGHPPSWIQANVFALAYVISRIVGAQSWSRGQVVADFPIVQMGFGSLPWLVSLWVPGEHKIWWWVAGLAIDIVGVFVVSGEQVLARSRERTEQVRRRATEAAEQGTLREHRDWRGNRRTALDRVEGAVVIRVGLAPEHLAERLGLFVIIVLGEGVIQVIHSASEADWNIGLLAAGGVSLGLSVGMFTLSLIYGYAGIPDLEPCALSTRALLALHWVGTASIVALSAVLAAMIVEPRDSLPDQQRWLLCGAVSTYLTVALVAYIATRGRRWGPIGLWLLTGLAVPVAGGIFGAHWSARAMVGYAALVLAAHVWLARRGRAARAAALSE